MNEDKIYNHVTAIVLSGGKSTRMQREKGLVHFQGKRMVDHVLETVQQLTRNVILVANHNDYNCLGVPVMPDIFAGAGPIGGLYTGLTNSKSQKNLVLACDTPFVSVDFLSSLLKECGQEDVLVPVHGGMREPLCAVYDQRCVPELKRRIESGALKMMELLDALAFREIKVDTDRWNTKELFANINTPGDLKKYEEIK